MKLNQIIVIFIFLFSLTLVSYSQTTVCNLNLQFFEIYGNGFLGNVNAKLKVGNKKEINPTKISEILVYDGLSSGIYQVELNKKGYKKLIKKFSVDCSLADDTNSVFENIFLIEGKSKEVVKLDSTNVKVAFAISDSDKTEAITSFQISSEDAKPINKSPFKLITPPYPPAAKAVRAKGTVNVQITIDEDGNVITAEALDGHALLRGAAVKAVRQSKFSPTLLEGKQVRVTGKMVYNFGK